MIPVLEQNDGVKEEEEDMEDDTAEAERPEIRAINLEEQRALAKNLEKIGGDKWKVLAKKLGFQSDEVWHAWWLCFFFGVDNVLYSFLLFLFFYVYILAVSSYLGWYFSFAFLLLFLEWWIWKYLLEKFLWLFWLIW